LVDTFGRSGINDDSELIYRLAVLALARRPLTGTLAGIVVPSPRSGHKPDAHSALAIAASIEDPPQRAQALADVVAKLAEAGRVEQALTVAIGIEDSM
jgi:hypothetical protein